MANESVCKAGVKFSDIAPKPNFIGDKYGVKIEEVIRFEDFFNKEKFRTPEMSIIDYGTFVIKDKETHEEVPMMNIVFIDPKDEKTKVLSLSEKSVLKKDMEDIIVPALNELKVASVKCSIVWRFKDMVKENDRTPANVGKAKGYYCFE